MALKTIDVRVAGSSNSWARAHNDVTVAKPNRRVFDETFTLQANWSHGVLINTPSLVYWDMHRCFQVGHVLFVSSSVEMRSGEISNKTFAF